MTKQEVIKLINDEIYYAKNVNTQMAMGMVQIIDLINRNWKEE